MLHFQKLKGGNNLTLMWTMSSRVDGWFSRVYIAATMDGYLKNKRPSTFTIKDHPLRKSNHGLMNKVINRKNSSISHDHDICDFRLSIRRYQHKKSCQSIGYSTWLHENLKSIKIYLQGIVWITLVIAGWNISFSANTFIWSIEVFTFAVSSLVTRIFAI